MKSKKRKVCTRKSFKPSKLTVISSFEDLYMFILNSPGAITCRYRSLLYGAVPWPGIAAMLAIIDVAIEANCKACFGTISLNDQAILFELVELLSRDTMYPSYYNQPRT